MARKKQRETYGNGSITPKKGKDGKQAVDRQGRPIWRVCLTFGTETYIDAKGDERKRQRKVQKVVHGTLADARKVAKQLNEEYERVDLDSAKQTFADAVDAWATSMENAATCSAAKLRDYKTRLSYMTSEIGDKAMPEIKKQDVENALAAVKAKRSLSQETTKQVLAVTKRVFQHAVSNEWIARNPCNAIAAPRVKKTVDRRSLTPDECSRLRARLDKDEAEAYEEFRKKEIRQVAWKVNHRRSRVKGISAISGFIAIRIMLATGMRRGEALGLTWANVDFANGQINVRQSLNAQMQVKEPKTAAGVRALFVDSDTLAHLAKWKDFQAEALSKIGLEEDADAPSFVQTENTPVCCTDIGSWLDPTNLGRWWNTYRKEIGLPDFRMHELRHTQATMLLGNGVDVKTVQTRLGHSTSALTLDQYAHAIPANDKAAADLMGSIYGNSATSHESRNPAKSPADTRGLPKSA